MIESSGFNTVQPAVPSPHSSGRCATVGPLKPPIDPAINKRITPPPVLSPRALTVPGMPGTWDVVQTLTSHEKALAWDLIDAGIDYFLPLAETRKKCGDRFRTLFEPLIGGYVFINSDDVHSTRATLFQICKRHVIRFISVTDQHQLITDLNALHFAIRERKAISVNFAPGRRCRVIAGPFAGYFGEVDREEKRGRVFINVNTLGQSVPFEIDTAFLEPLE